ncbi:hypothetical protein LX36DRAFT_659524 [Colletotrichum falcatum]|nr:hypothetical protein LX36DRAFT_659524 [Colletotrichum falcatum]
MFTVPRPSAVSLPAFPIPHSHHPIQSIPTCPVPSLPSPIHPARRSSRALPGCALLPYLCTSPRARESQKSKPRGLQLLNPIADTGRTPSLWLGRTP